MIDERLSALETRVVDRVTAVEGEMTAMKQAVAERFNALESRVAAKEKAMGKVEENVSAQRQEIFFLRNENDRLSVQNDDLEQYGRRMNIRIDGISYDHEESQQQLKSKIEEVLKSVGVSVYDNMFVRFNRSGPRSIIETVC